MEASGFLGPGAPSPTLRSLEFLRAFEFQAELVNVSRSQKFPLQLVPERTSEGAQLLRRCSYKSMNTFEIGEAGGVDSAKRCCGELHHLGARRQSVVDVALHARTKLLQRHLPSIGEPHAVVMWAALQASEGDVFICRNAERFLHSRRDAFQPQFHIIGHAYGG